MKRTIFIILAAISLFSFALTACGSAQSTQPVVASPTQKPTPTRTPKPTPDLTTFAFSCGIKHQDDGSSQLVPCSDKQSYGERDLTLRLGPGQTDLSLYQHQPGAADSTDILITKCNFLHQIDVQGADTPQIAQVYSYDQGPSRIILLRAKGGKADTADSFLFLPDRSASFSFQSVNSSGKAFNYTVSVSTDDQPIVTVMS